MASARELPGNVLRKLDVKPNFAANIHVSAMRNSQHAMKFARKCVSQYPPVELGAGWYLLHMYFPDAPPISMEIPWVTQDILSATLCGRVVRP